MSVKINLSELYKDNLDPWKTGEAKDARYSKVLNVIKKESEGKKFNAALDLGCGNGAFTAQLFEFAEKVVGVDFSSEAVDYASKKFPKIQFRQGDISNLGNLDLEGKFGLITVLDVLYYFPSHKIREILDVIWGLSEEGGMVVFRHYAPGLNYLSHGEWEQLLSEKFNIVAQELTETGHSLMFCQKKFADIALTFDWETWQPIPEGKKIDWDEDIFKPTETLLNLAKKHDIRLSFFIEMGEYYWCKKNLSEVAHKMEEQWMDIVKRGHDVQIHLHPTWLPELGARYDKNKDAWVWDERYQRMQDIPLDIKEILKNCKRDLENIIKKIKPEYEAIVFRAGKYQIQPNKEIFKAFEEAGIVADSSVWKGGYSKEFKFDFRNAFSGSQPYFASEYEVNNLAPWGENSILEIPIFSQGGKRWLLEDEQTDWGELVWKEIFYRKKFIRFDNLKFAPVNFKNIILRKMVSLWLRILNKAERLVNKGNKAVPRNNLVFTAIGHTKQNINLEKLENFINRFGGDEFVRFRRISDIAKESQKNKNLGYEEHAKQQVDYDRQAIMGDERNWRQSAYIQNKIPLDRENILDLGCGSGYWTFELGKIFKKVVGVDFSREFVDFARKKYPQNDFRVEDMHKLNFKDEEFDCVYTDNVLEHSPYPQRTLAEIYRVLKDKGILVAAIPPDARNPLYSGLDHVWKTDKDEIETRLREAGFVNIKIEDINTLEKFGANLYWASNNSMLVITAWKSKGKESSSLQRVKDLMDWIYSRVEPFDGAPADPWEVLRERKALCGGYANLLSVALNREDFINSIITLYAFGHEKGFGPCKIDSHQLVEAEIVGEKMILDPMANRIINADFKTALKNPAIIDEAVKNDNKDKRWQERNYNLYCGKYLYERTKLIGITDDYRKSVVPVRVDDYLNGRQGWGAGLYNRASHSCKNFLANRVNYVEIYKKYEFNKICKNKK